MYKYYVGCPGLTVISQRAIWEMKPIVCGLRNTTYIGTISWNMLGSRTAAQQKMGEKMSNARIRGRGTVDTDGLSARGDAQRRNPTPILLAAPYFNFTDSAATEHEFQ